MKRLWALLMVALMITVSLLAPSSGYAGKGKGEGPPVDTGENQPGPGPV